LYKRIFVLFLISIVLAGFITINLYEKTRKNHKPFRALGEVYNSDFKDLDLSIELSGRLSSDNQYSDKKAYPENNKLNSSSILENNLKYSDYSNSVETSQNIVYSNKLLSWGILRKPNNETPAADPGAPELLAKYNGIYLGDTSKKVIYMTFDEGYENGYTPKILDVLKENKVQAVFFITGPYLNKHQDLVRRMVEDGHIVGNHTVHHPSLPTLTDEEIEEEILGLERAFNEKFNRKMQFLRPPKGEYSERTLAITNKLGYQNMFWSFAYDDWYRDKIRGPEYARNIVMNNLHNGAILLLHAVSKDNADALDMIIKGAREKGYEFGDFDELKE